MATSLYKGQIPFRLKGQTICIHHKGNQLDLYCEDCHELVCVKCLSTVHKSHTVCGLSEITPQNKLDIQNFIEKTEKVDIVQITQYITSTDIHLKDNHSNFAKFAHQLRTQTNKLKQDLDLLTAQTLSLYQPIEDDNTKILQTYKQDLDIYNAQLKQKVQDCKTALQRGSNIQMYDAGCDIRSLVTLPVKPTLGTASFRLNQNPQSLLEQALGEVENTSGQYRGQGHDRRPVASLAGEASSPQQQRSDPKVRTPSTQQRSEPKVRTPSTQQRSEQKARTPSTQQRSEGRKEVSSPVYALLPQTKVLGEYRSPCDITSVCLATDGHVWTSYNGSYTLTLLDREGKVKQEVKHSTKIKDISLSPTTNTLWACCSANTIIELVSGRLVHIFSTSEFPLCICVTASNHVIVGMAKHLSKFTTTGKLVRNTSAAGTGKLFVCSPWRISECPVTHNVAVADWDSKRDGGGGKLHVVVMDSDFKELFVYDGEIPRIYKPTLQSGGKPFNPSGVVYDSVGNLVIGDWTNNRVLLISGHGEFLRLIHTDDCWTWAVGVDREDVLWAVFRTMDWSYNVKLLQYSSV